ncbi:FliM/FliN family flagellar motor switch protein [Aurantimonas sp. 22II-16-19i]|uniref:FliM/FliN family flagellar motor switch protein n=1 Tax=Aurantimonas sp. 22II-16-19i TaxID=1317114 RepID=UPI0009F7B85A|nr:FliM/FliN family flagellar motor switch protein [Aurantimonas sp. 22II-16-19i]ORE95078.1 flagellar motor switch protein FliM [Aurantimonas sp. 22II-16-19i]
MSETAIASDPAEIHARLKSATELDPARLPRLAHICADWTDELSARLRELAPGVIEIEYQQCEVEDAPDPEDAELAKALIAPLLSNCFLRPSFVTADRKLVELVVATFLGCEPSADLAQSREPTALDQHFVRLFFAKVLETAAKVFRPMTAFDLSLGSFGTAADLAETIGEEAERYFVFRFELTAAGFQAPFALALPKSFLSPHRRFLSGTPQKPEMASDEAWKRGIEASFAQSDLKIEAVLCKKNIPLSQVARFHVGATIELDVGLTSLIPLECEDRPMFRAQVGRSRESYVVRIEERIDPAQEFIDDILSD